MKRGESRTKKEGRERGSVGGGEGEGAGGGGGGEGREGELVSTEPHGDNVAMETTPPKAVCVAASLFLSHSLSTSLLRPAPYIHYNLTPNPLT